jgi:predicted Rossmann fold nucleotide-binding protein DprA/Smf involved in DNA uptake
VRGLRVKKTTLLLRQMNEEIETGCEEEQQQHHAELADKEQQEERLFLELSEMEKAQIILRSDPGYHEWIDELEKYLTEELINHD